MKKGLLPLCLLLCSFNFTNIYGQSTSDCTDMKAKILDAFKNTQTLRVAYTSSSRKIYVDYEMDAKANTHFIYKDVSENNIQLALIKMKDKTFATDSKGEWQNKITSNFNYGAWIDSCVGAAKVFTKTFKFCSSSNDVIITGTTYSKIIAQIENDTFNVWFNKATNKLERITQFQKQKDVYINWYFDIPFEIQGAEDGLKDLYNSGFSVFPPAFNYNEDLDGTEPVFNIPSKVAELKGGQAELFKFLGKNIKYPKTARENGIEGTVYIGFVIEKDGGVSNVAIKRGISTDCNQEALRVIKLMNGKWQPGTFKGQNVRVAYTLPIKFKLG